MKFFLLLNMLLWGNHSRLSDQSIDETIENQMHWFILRVSHYETLLWNSTYFFCCFCQTKQLKWWVTVYFITHAGCFHVNLFILTDLCMSTGWGLNAGELGASQTAGIGGKRRKEKTSGVMDKIKMVEGASLNTCQGFIQTTQCIV